MYDACRQLLLHRHSLQSAHDVFCASPDTAWMLHENYPRYTDDSHTLSQMADLFSDANVIYPMSQDSMMVPLGLSLLSQQKHSARLEFPSYLTAAKVQSRLETSPQRFL